MKPSLVLPVLFSTCLLIVGCGEQNGSTDSLAMNFEADAGTAPSDSGNMPSMSDAMVGADATASPMSRCDDDIRNGDESGVDCGGACAPCAAGIQCNDNEDCQDRVCRANRCGEATCFDGVTNGTETDVDCGGECDPCRPDQTCAMPSDCTSGVCTRGQCAAATCDDGIRNASEGDVDCGGECDPCLADQTCAMPSDCASGVCTQDQCAAATCEDGVRNAREGDVDCGGPCSPCTDGQRCLNAADCLSQVCSDEQCQAPRCDDAVTNGTETQTDCGGMDCMGCPAGGQCNEAFDCESNICTGNLCEAPSCDDGVLNGTEWGTDCGPGCGHCDLNELSCERIDAVWPAEWVMVEEDMLRFGNIVRVQGTDCGRQEGVQPTHALVMNERLRCAARRHSFDMAIRDYFSPVAPEGTDIAARVQAVNYDFQIVGQNIAAGQESGEQVIDAWVDSEGHCLNLMNSAFTEIGLGYVFQEDAQYLNRFTQVFGAPRQPDP